MMEFACFEFGLNGTHKTSLRIFAVTVCVLFCVSAFLYKTKIIIFSFKKSIGKKLLNVTLKN